MDGSTSNTFKSVLHVLKKLQKESVINMGSKTVLEFDQVSVSYTYLENIIYYVYSDILVSFVTKIMTA